MPSAASSVAGVDMEEPKPASFSGRLNIQDFAFKGAGAPSPLLRRSPRLSAPTSPSSIATPLSPSPSPTPTKKRRAIAQSPSPSPSKRARKPAGYAPPSTYAHLKPLTDTLAPGLYVLFVGLNPGILTAQTGHAYAHPSNLFWKLMYSSGVTTRLCHYSEDKDMPRLYNVGLTNIVARPSRNGAELSKQEMDEGVGILEEKVRRCKPEVVCFVGKSIWESVWRVKKGRAIKKAEFRYGWQDDAEMFGACGKGGDGEEGEGEWAGARVFVSSSTSGLAATLSPAEKQENWRELGAWVEQRREKDAAGAQSKAEEPSVSDG